VADAWSRRRDTTDRTERDAAPDDARDGVVVAGLALLMLFASFAILPTDIDEPHGRQSPI